MGAKAVKREEQTVWDEIDGRDPPFACPPDIVLDLPVPPSVNRTRKINWADRLHSKWIEVADKCVLAAKCKVVGSIRGRKIDGPFEAIIQLSAEHTKMDLDNAIKGLIDYARRIELIVDDGPKYMRRLTLEWGEAPTGCRLTLRPMEQE